MLTCLLTCHILTYFSFILTYSVTHSLTYLLEFKIAVETGRPEKGNDTCSCGRSPCLRPCICRTFVAMRSCLGLCRQTRKRETFTNTNTVRCRQRPCYEHTWTLCDMNRETHTNINTDTVSHGHRHGHGCCLPRMRTCTARTETVMNTVRNDRKHVHRVGRVLSRMADTENGYGRGHEHRATHGN